MKRTMIVLLAGALVTILLVIMHQEETLHHIEFVDHRSSTSVIDEAYAYPPAVAILSNSKNCMSCHVNNGPWHNHSELIVDILDADTKKSLKQSDGSFVIEAERWKQKKLLTVIGWAKGKSAPAPSKN